MKPKKLRFTRHSYGELGGRTWVAEPIDKVRFFINKGSDGVVSWYLRNEWTFDIPERYYLENKQQAVAACQKRWDRFVRKQVRAMLERPAPQEKKP